MYEIRLYISEDAKDLYLNWCLKLRDFKVRIAIDRRVNRLELGNFGDHKF
jgi:putative component of toxin-antitoxin plasmid stabilization module